jgi:spermidine synthase
VTLANKPEKNYDVIVGDVFHDITIPYHLVTLEYMRLIKSRLKENGIYLMNLVDAFPDPKLLKSIFRTLEQEFKEVQIYLQTLPEEPARLTYVLIAGKNLQKHDIIKAEMSARSWMNVTSVILDNDTPVAVLPVLTDDFSPVDRLISDLLMKRH